MSRPLYDDNSIFSYEETKHLIRTYAGKGDKLICFFCPLRRVVAFALSLDLSDTYHTYEVREDTIAMRPLSEVRQGVIDWVCEKVLINEGIL